MKYRVTFSVTDTYPTAEIEAKDRHEAVKLYQQQWEEGKLSDQGIEKNASYSVVSVWKSKK